MKRIHTTAGILGIALLALAATAAEGPRLLVSASVPVVEIIPRSSDAPLIRLPKLTYDFRIRSSCAEGLNIQYVMISVADTRKKIMADELANKTEVIIPMTIPAKQIAPVNVADFCRAGSTDSDGNDYDPGLKTVAGAFSAQASMLCADETVEQVTFVSASLDVSLSCISVL
jgi:hypothetical protein